MQEKEYIIFGDESDKEGKYYSNFYGGLLVGASQYERITRRLNAIKQELNLFGEVKWEKVTERYLPKYEILMRHFFEEVAKGNVKVRIMFRQNAYKPKGLTPEQMEMQYFLLYYQFIKHAFGFEFIAPADEGAKLSLHFDQFPDTKEKAERFKGFLLGLQKSRKFQAANLRIAKKALRKYNPMNTSYFNAWMSCWVQWHFASMTSIRQNFQEGRDVGKGQKRKRPCIKPRLAYISN